MSYTSRVRRRAGYLRRWAQRRCRLHRTTCGCYSVRSPRVTPWTPLPTRQLALPVRSVALTCALHLPSRCCSAILSTRLHARPWPQNEESNLHSCVRENAEPTCDSERWVGGLASSTAASWLRPVKCDCHVRTRQRLWRCCLLASATASLSASQASSSLARYSPCCAVGVVTLHPGRDASRPCAHDGDRTRDLPADNRVLYH